MHVDGSYNGTSRSNVSQTVFLRTPFFWCRYLVWCHRGQNGVLIRNYVALILILPQHNFIDFSVWSNITLAYSGADTCGAQGCVPCNSDI